jgi:hypothetical protein
MTLHNVLELADWSAEKTVEKNVIFAVDVELAGEESC